MPQVSRGDTTLIFTADDVRAVLGLADCADAVERVLALHGEGGGFHAKAAAAFLGRPYFVARTNGNFPGNPGRNGLPTIQGVIVLSDAADGRVLALLDSTEITTLRTGAATAVAARYLARPDSRTAAMIGCGIQGRVQLRAGGRVAHRTGLRRGRLRGHRTPVRSGDGRHARDPGHAPAESRRGHVHE